jgi:serine protease Do
MRPSLVLLSSILVASLLLPTEASAGPSARKALKKDAIALPSLAPVLALVRPAVVSIESHIPGSEAAVQQPELEEGPLEHFYARPRRRDEKNAEEPGRGSGVLIDARGLVLTNSHLLQGARLIRVRLDDGREFEADVIGRDLLTDLALLRLKNAPEDLPVAILGDSSTVQLGEWVLAVGNPSRPGARLSLGIVAAVPGGRMLGLQDDLLVVDTLLPSGLTGGPLVNLRGEVIGITTDLLGADRGVHAVPLNLARALVHELETDGVATRGWMGVAIQELTPLLARALGVELQKGAIVSQVSVEGPAEQAGLKPDDVIAAVDGQRIGSASDFARAIERRKPGNVAKLTVHRGPESRVVEVTLASRKEQSPPPPKPEGDGGGTGNERLERLGLKFQTMEARTAQATGLPEQGVLITNVLPGSPAAEAGLAQGMVVLEAAGAPVKTSAQLAGALDAARPGTPLLLRVHTRSGRFLRVLRVP